jgi:co-chaperonin GroES (HSP10)
MLETKYLDNFKRLGLRKELFQLRGDRILVEILPKEELTTASGLFIATDTKYRSATNENQATLGVVLLVGEGYYDEETGVDKPMDIKPGNIVLLSSMGLKYYSSFPGIQGYVPNTLALSRDSEVHMIVPDFAAYEQMKEVLK